MLLALNLSFPGSTDDSSATSGNSSPTSSPSDSAKLGWILIRKRWISAAQLQTFLSKQPQSQQKLGELLLSAALITEGQLKQALREQYWRRNGYWVI